MDRNRILWIDNDRAFLLPFVEEIRDAGYEVDVAGNVSSGSELLRTGGYALVILDVMIPTRSEDEEREYSAEETDLGYRTGLVFYRRHREFLLQQRIPVLVLTVRLDSSIRKEFAAAGLPSDCFATKYALSDPVALAAKMQSMIDRA